MIVPSRRVGLSFVPGCGSRALGLKKSVARKNLWSKNLRNSSSSPGGYSEKTFEQQQFWNLSSEVLDIKTKLPQRRWLRFYEVNSSAEKQSSILRLKKHIKTNAGHPLINSCPNWTASPGSPLNMHNSSSKMDSQIIYSIFQHFNFEMGNLTLKLSYTSDLALTTFHNWHSCRFCI